MTASLCLSTLILLGFVNAYAQQIIDGSDVTSKQYNANIGVTVKTDDYKVTRIMVEIPKAESKVKSDISVVLRSTLEGPRNYIYLPLLVEDGEERELWSPTTGQNVTRTWIGRNRGIFFATCRLPATKLKDFVLEVLIGNSMTNPTRRYSLTKLNIEQGVASEPDRTGP